MNLRLGLIARITLLVLLIEVVAFTAMGWLYLERYNRFAEDHLFSRFELVADMLGRDDLAVSAIARPSFMQGLLEVPYLSGLVVGGNGRVLVSTDPRQLGQLAAKLDGFDPAWFGRERAGPQYLLEGERLTSVLKVFSQGSDRLLYTLVLQVSKAEMLAEKARIISLGLIASLAFILLSSLGIVVITQGFQRNARAVEAFKQKLEQVLWGSGDAWWEWNLQTAKVHFDGRLGEILGCSKEQLEEDQLSWERLIHPQDLISFRAELEEHLQQGEEHFSARIRVRCHNGDWKWLQSRGRLVERDGRGRPLRLTGTLSDISRQVAQEDELHLAQTVFDHIDQA
ncbi:MAG: PAS domain-containing protein, partial [Gammaproteobacteria bacterium]|nr:PAS domain-containing protein [Gammaproteobacteria bacterium]